MEAWKRNRSYGSLQLKKMTHTHTCLRDLPPDSSKWQKGNNQLNRHLPRQVSLQDTNNCNKEVWGLYTARENNPKNQLPYLQNWTWNTFHAFSSLNSYLLQGKAICSPNTESKANPATHSELPLAVEVLQCFPLSKEGHPHQHCMSQHCHSSTTPLLQDTNIRANCHTKHYAGSVGTSKQI